MSFDEHVWHELSLIGLKLAAGNGQSVSREELSRYNYSVWVPRVRVQLLNGLKNVQGLENLSREYKNLQTLRYTILDSPLDGIVTILPKGLFCGRKEVLLDAFSRGREAEIKDMRLGAVYYI